jgi:hypothetical protein
MNDSHGQNWPILWPTIRNLLYGRTIAAYNAPFDLRMMQHRTRDTVCLARESEDRGCVDAIF